MTDGFPSSNDAAFLRKSGFQVSNLADLSAVAEPGGPGGARGGQGARGAEPPPERFEPPLESFETRIEIRKSYVMSAFLGAQPPPEYFLGAEPHLELFSGSATACLIFVLRVRARVSES
jgi:hypothetical protein